MCNDHFLNSLVLSIGSHDMIHYDIYSYRD